MADSRYRRDPARLLLRRLGILALAGLLAFAASGVLGVYKKAEDTAALRAQAEAEYADLLDREEHLLKDTERLATDRGMEEALRIQYGLAGEGEGLIVIVEPQIPASVQETSSSITRWFRNIFKRW